MTDRLDIIKEVQAINKMYANDPRQSSFSLLLCGEHGSGKSFFLRSCRKPVFIDSFDPGGTKGLRDYIAKGEIIVDTRWEAEDPKKPFAFSKWKQEMAKREQMGLFNHLGTYVLDSMTTWSDAIMNYILKLAAIPGQAPRWAHDYIPQKMEIRNWLKELLSLPCDFILTGHLEGHRDEVSGAVSYRFMTTGKAAITVPLLFDEIWVMAPKKLSSGVEYRILTQSTGQHIARSRLAKGGLLDTYEKPDMKSILKKVGFPHEDKPLFNEEN